jgi:beta-galactosidase
MRRWAWAFIVVAAPGGCQVVAGIDRYSDCDPHVPNSCASAEAGAVDAPSDAPSDAPGCDPQLPIRINAGGAAVGSFAADIDFDGGASYGNDAAIVADVDSAAPAAVYQSYRYEFAGSFSYSFRTLHPGPYRLRLHFAEIYPNDWEAGARLIAVSVQGKLVVPRLDVFVQAGGGNRALVADLEATPDANGTITVELTPLDSGRDDSAMLSGIELLCE